MSMSLLKTRSNGRLLHGKTPYGDFNIEWDADGSLVSEFMKIKTPLEPKKKPKSKRRGCRGCGGSKYDPTDYNKPGGSDELIQQLD